jgi:hypothetical protein
MVDVEKLSAIDGEVWFNIAEMRALLGDTQQSVDALGKAIEKGFFNYPFMVKDPLLNSARNDPAFQEVLGSARAKHEAFKKEYALQ